MEYSYDGHPNWKVLLSEVSCSPLRRSQQSSLNTELKTSLSSIPTHWTQLEVVWDPPGALTHQQPLAAHVLRCIPQNTEPQPGPVCVLNSVEQKPRMKGKIQRFLPWHRGPGTISAVSG